MTYQIQYSSTSPYDTNVYDQNLQHQRLQVTVGVDNEGGYRVSAAITVLAVNATISNSEKGPLAQSATVTLLIQAKNSFGVTLYVLPFGNTTSFKVSISDVKTVYGNDWFANLIYSVYSETIYSPVNRISLTYVRDTRNPTIYNPQLS